MAQSSLENTTRYHIIEPKADPQEAEEHSVGPRELNYELAQSSTNRSWKSTVLLQAFTLFWLVPISALLWLNAVGFIVGASAWCPGRRCYREMFSTNSTQRALQLDKRDSNVLGGLQIVAKLLEAWFVFISATLLYLATMFFASRSDGLPISYLTKSLNFATPVGLLDSMPSFRRVEARAVTPGTRTLSGQAIWLLVLLSAVLFVLCNLMGPATAILVLPELQWISTSQVDKRNLTSFNSDTGPLDHPGSWFDRFSECDTYSFDALDFTCTNSVFGKSLDAWLETYQATSGSLGMATQSGMMFTMNKTGSDGPNSRRNDAELAWWVPSRKTVATLQDDLATIELMSTGNNASEINSYWNEYDYLGDDPGTYELYNRSLDLTLQRSGPLLGAVTHYWLDDYQPPQTKLPYRNFIELEDGSIVICYEGYTLTGQIYGNGTTSSTDFTKCTRTGAKSTWNQFYVGGRYDSNGQRGDSARVTIISSDITVFLEDGQTPPWFDPRCLIEDGGLTDCNWNRLFAEAQPTNLTRNRMRNMVTIEYSLEDYFPTSDSNNGSSDGPINVFNGTSDSTSNTTSNGTSSDPSPNARVLLAVDFAAYRALTNFSLAVSPVQNPARLVRTERLPTEDETMPMVVDSSWILAGWSADKQGYVSPNRPTPNLLMFILETMMASQELVIDEMNFADYDLDAIGILPIMQALSLIDWSGDDWNETAYTLNPDSKHHQLLQRHARMFVWAYGFNSRSSILGAVVAVAGCMVVLAQGVLGFADRRKYRTPTQLLVAALEHVPQGEFVGRDHSETMLGRVELRVVDDDNRAGKLSFHRPGS